MADSKISALTEKTTFGETDFLAGTQGADAGDNRKYGKAAIQEAARTMTKPFAVIVSNSFNSTIIASSGDWSDVSLSRTDDILTISSPALNVFVISSLLFVSSKTGATASYFQRDSTGPSEQHCSFRAISDGALRENWSGNIIVMY